MPCLQAQKLILPPDTDVIYMTCTFGYAPNPPAENPLVVPCHCQDKPQPVQERFKNFWDMVQPLALVVFSHKPGSTPPFSVPLKLLHTPDLISLANVLFDLQNPTHKWPPGESPNPQGERQVMVLNAPCICALTSIKVLKIFHSCDWYFFFSQPKQNLSLREQGSRTGLGSHGIPRTWNTADQKQ